MLGQKLHPSVQCWDKKCSGGQTPEQKGAPRQKGQRTPHEYTNR